MTLVVDTLVATTQQQLQMVRVTGTVQSYMCSEVQQKAEITNTCREEEIALIIGEDDGCPNEIL
jgi:hypothetical protein